MTEIRTVRWNVFEIRVELREDTPEEFTDKAVAGVWDEPDDKGRFRVWFKALPAEDAFSHEAWHLFFTILMFTDEHNHTMAELNSEIYAYSFQYLYSQIKDCVTGMKLYKKLWDERQAEKEKEDGRHTD